MKLKELYDQTPVSKHGDIRVIGDQVFVAGVEQYALGADSELIALTAANRLAALEAAVAKIQETVTRIDAKTINSAGTG